ncbi:MAG TPA: hypothetical protein VFA26_13665, partial [Gemmataceae bacterium]|nr:hypothetical protein [Gemmataceae bacterium]
MDPAAPQASSPVTGNNRPLFLFSGIGLLALLGVGLFVLAGAAVGVYFCFFHLGKVGPGLVEIGDPERRDTSVPVPKVRFTDWTEKSGVRFRHVNGAFGKKLLPETMGGGVAVIDYDNDNHPDLLF